MSSNYSDNNSTLEEYSSHSEISCSKHAYNKCIFICTDPNKTGSVFKCGNCVIEEDIEVRNLLSLQQIQQCENNTVLWNWPLPNDRELIEKVRQISTKPRTDEKYKQEIQAYFQELKSQVSKKIDEKQAQMEKQAENLWNFNKRIIDQYNKLSSKMALRETLENLTADQEEISQKIKNIMSDVLSNIKQVKDTLQTDLDQLALQESSVDFEGPEIIKEEILLSISKISMFLVDGCDLLIQTPIDDHQTTEQPQRNGNVDMLMALASNRLNNTSEEFNIRLRNYLEKFRKVFDKLEIGQVFCDGKHRLELELLDEEDLNEVNVILHTLIEGKKKQNKQEDLEDNQSKRKLQVKDILGLVQNPSNFITTEMQELVESVLSKASRYISSHSISTIHKEGFTQLEFKDLKDEEISKLSLFSQEIKPLLAEDRKSQEGMKQLLEIAKHISKTIVNKESTKFYGIERLRRLISNGSNLCSDAMMEEITQLLEGIKYYVESFPMIANESVNNKIIQWKGLDAKQLTHLSKLGQCMVELNQQYGNEYSSCSIPNALCQFNSHTVLHSLQNTREKLTAKQDQELLQLLVDLPLFELLQFTFRQTPKWTFIKPNYANSHLLEITEDNISTKVSQSSCTKGNAVTACVLDNQLVYSLTCTFNKPLCVFSHIMIGLIEATVIDSKFVGQDCENSAFWSSSGRGANELIVGDLLNSNKLNSVITSIDVRFCVASQEIYFADSSHNNITKGEANLIKKNSKYRFGMSFHTSGDYSIAISNVQVYSRNTPVGQFSEGK